MLVFLDLSWWGVGGGQGGSLEQGVVRKQE